MGGGEFNFIGHPRIQLLNGWFTFTKKNAYTDTGCLQIITNLCRFDQNFNKCPSQCPFRYLVKPDWKTSRMLLIEGQLLLFTFTITGMRYPMLSSEPLHRKGKKHMKGLAPVMMKMKCNSWASQLCPSQYPLSFPVRLYEIHKYLNQGRYSILVKVAQLFLSKDSPHLHRQFLIMVNYAFKV